MFFLAINTSWEFLSIIKKTRKMKCTCVGNHFTLKIAPPLAKEKFYYIRVSSETLKFLWPVLYEHEDLTPIRSHTFL